jgi:hypothetical protein
MKRCDLAVARDDEINTGVDGHPFGLEPYANAPGSPPFGVRDRLPQKPPEDCGRAASRCR